MNILLFVFLCLYFRFIMSAKDTVRRNKTAILATLCGDQKLILNKVHEKKLITQREYNNLKSINREDVEGHVIALVDKIMDKGEDTCRDFLNLLQTDEDVKTTFPDLKNIQKNDTCLLPLPVQATRLDNSGMLAHTSSVQKWLSSIPHIEAHGVFHMKQLMPSSKNTEFYVGKYNSVLLWFPQMVLHKRAKGGRRWGLYPNMKQDTLLQCLNQYVYADFLKKTQDGV